MRSVLRRLRILLTHSAFREAPLTVLWRCATMALSLPSRRRLVFPLSRDGERVQVSASLRYTPLATFLLRDWCEPELHYLDSLLSEDAVFMDVGANAGLYTLRAATLVGPKGRVVSVEPGRAALEMLRTNIALNPTLASRISLFPVALSDVAGSATLYHVAEGYDPQAFSLFADGTAQAAETVETRTLDDLVRDLGLTRLDLVKLDVEGAEALVLEGAVGTLERLRPTVIFEVNSTILARTPVAHDAAWSKLTALGYSFFRLVDGTLRPVAELPADFGNLIARPPPVGESQERPAEAPARLRPHGRGS